MATGKTDRRVRKTRALLLQGLIQLLEQKEIKDISVKELSDLVDINRGTFYLHYTDIYDMLNKIEDELFQEFNEILDRDLNSEIPTTALNTVLQDIFMLLEKHRDIARVMIGPHGDLAFVNRLRSLVAERSKSILEQAHSSNNDEYLTSFIISGCVGIIETWLNHPSPLPPAEMAELCSHLLEKGVSM